MQEGSPYGRFVSPSNKRWASDQRAVALQEYFRTGSRRQVGRLTGVPERTLSVWLTHPKLADERRTIQEGLLRAVEQDAAVRGAELVEATREAILVCRKALRRDPDGKTAGSLLTALTRAREAEDRIQRLDAGEATEINGAAVSAEEVAEFREWQEDRLAYKAMSDEELVERVRSGIVSAVRGAVDSNDAILLRRILVEFSDASGQMANAMREEPALALRLHGAVTGALGYLDLDPAKEAKVLAWTGPA